MVEEAKESPQLAKPAAEEKRVDKSEEEIKTLLETLDKVGVKSSQHLEGIAQNAKEYGYVTNLLGQERQKTLDLERKLQELETRVTSKPKESWDDYPSGTQGQPVDLDKFIRKAIRDEREVERREMAEMQKRQLQAWNAIQSDVDYGNVRNIWEGKLKDPNFVYQINAGITDPVREYQETVRDFYKGLAMQAKTVIEQVKKGGVKPPHVESGERGSGNIVSEGKTELPEVLKRFNELKQKTSKGIALSTEEELELARIATFGLFPTSPGPPPKPK